MRSIIGLLVFLAACSGGESAGQRSEAMSASAPVAQGDPNTTYQPALPGQTRAPEQISGVTLETQTIATGLVRPWAIAFLPDGRMLVTERPGRIRIVTQDGAMSEPIAGVPAVIHRGQGGLLDIAVSPSFARDRLIYWTYAEAREGETNGTSVARGRLSADGARLENVQVIFRQEPAWRSNGHFGSNLVFDRQGRLYVGLGDRQQDEPRELAQDLGGHLGKVVRINADGSVPSDNPFVGRAGARPELWSYGHRNVQGADLHPQTGESWTIDHGSRGRD